MESFIDNVKQTASGSGKTRIMKTVLPKQHETIPSHENVESQLLSPANDLEVVSPQLFLEPVEWPKRFGLARESSFGVTGIDAHAKIEEPSNFLPSPSICTFTKRPLHTMKISAKTDEALAMLLDKYKTYLAKTSSDFKDVAYTANIGVADFSQRAILIATSKEDAIMKFEQNKLVRGNEQLESTSNICFLFTGQGSQYPRMAKQLYETSPIFRMHFEYCENILKNNYNIDIAQSLWSKAKSTDVDGTLSSQTSIFCVQYALLQLWLSWGVKPDFTLGHSLGESAAAVCAGILTVEDSIKLLVERCRLIDQLPRGKMLVIKADKVCVGTLMDKFADGDQDKILDVAAINSNEQTVVAGDSEVVLDFGKFCKENNLKCIVLEATHAFHSKHMDPILDDLRKVAKTLKWLGGNDCKYISGMRGSLVEADKIDADYWVEHAREKVSFLDASKKAVEYGCRTFIEIGPQPVLSALVIKNNDTQLACLPSLKRTENEWETLLNTLGKLYVKGVKIDWEGFEKYLDRNEVSLSL